MQPETTVIPYNTSRELYRNAWARRRRRLAINLGIAALLAPAIVFPLAMILNEILPRDGDLLAMPSSFVFAMMALVFAGPVGLVLVGIGVAPPLDRRAGIVAALLTSGGSVLQGSPLSLFHRAWARWQSRCGAFLLAALLVTPALVALFTGVIRRILPTSGSFVDIPLQVLAWYLSAFLCAAAGLGAAFTALAMAEDRRIGVLPRWLGQAAIILDGIIMLGLLCMLSLLVWHRL